MAGLPEARSDPEQPESQGANLSIGKLSVPKTVSKKPKQTIGKSVEKEAKLIGQKPVAT